MMHKKGQDWAWGKLGSIILALLTLFAIIYVLVVTIGPKIAAQTALFRWFG